MILLRLQENGHELQFAIRTDGQITKTVYDFGKPTVYEENYMNNDRAHMLGEFLKDYIDRQARTDEEWKVAQAIVRQEELST